MGSSLSWMPPPEEREEHYIGIKWEIGKYYESDYSGGNGTWVADSQLIPFLKGLIAGSPDKSTQDDAQELIDAIKKYGKIHLTIH